MMKPVKRYYPPDDDKVEEADPEKLEDMKRLYKLSFKQDYEFDHMDDFYQLPIVMGNVYQSLTKEQKEEYKKWRDLEQRIRKNYFPELA